MSSTDPADFEIPHLHFESVDSTQTKAFEVFHSMTSIPFYITADFQTSGRGRQGRAWAMEKGRSIAMSIGIRTNADRLYGLPLVIGLSIARALEEPRLRIKWPNDLILENQKVGGILVESRSQGEQAEVVIGIGLNLLDFQTQPYSGLNQRVETSLLASTIVKDFRKFESEGFSVFRDEFESRMWKKGERVGLTVAGEVREVELQGVSPSGSLIVRTGSQLEVNDQGEIVEV